VSVYVDPVFQWCLEATKDGQARRVGARNRHRWSHMTADTSMELESFARRLGLRPEWSQLNHYDLTPGKRDLAVRMGAVEVTARELAIRAQVLRRTRGIGATPESVRVVLDSLPPDPIDEVEP